MSGRVDDYDYQLPEELVARRPLPRREDARMMVLDRARATIAHHRFSTSRNSLGRMISWC